MNWNHLVAAEDLAAALGAPDLVLVDCSFVLGGADAAAGELAWRESHLPGAGYAHLDRDLSDHRKPATAGRHPLPDAADLCAVLARLGITPDTQVVAYDNGDGAMAAARLWWLLRALGHRRVAVLDGGFARWRALVLPLETNAPSLRAGHYAADYDPAWLVPLSEVRASVADGRRVLIDARAPERFRGEVEPLDRKAGHIPGARNRPYAANLRDGRFKPAAELRADFEALLAGRPASEAVLYCGSGVTACHNLLAMEAAGLSGARLFPPSWSGWIADEANPIATGA